MMFGFVGSTATWNALTPTGIPFDFDHVLPPSVDRYAPTPVKVVPPPKTSLPVRTMIVPFVPAGLKPRPPTAWVGRLSPIDRHVIVSRSSAQTPPCPTLA